MKYYLYISDAKLDLLLSQISEGAKSKTGWEFKLDFKLFSISRKTERDCEQNRFQRLEKVTEFILENGNVGTVDQPDEYILDTLEMSRHEDYAPPSLIYFLGATDNTLIGLGGSLRHALGQRSRIDSGSSRIKVKREHKRIRDKASEYDGIRSDDPDLIPDLLERVFMPDLFRTYDDKSSQLLTQGKTIAESSNEWLSGFYEGFQEELTGHKQQLEFLAKRLLYKPIPSGLNDSRHILLATPLYVALVE